MNTWEREGKEKKEIRPCPPDARRAGELGLGDSPTTHVQGGERKRKSRQRVNNLTDGGDGDDDGDGDELARQVDDDGGVPAVTRRGGTPVQTLPSPSR